MTAALDHRDLYRLPWTLSDNAIAWLEPTMKCNLACEGCYRANVNEHKSLEEVGADLDVFERYRKTDGISIAGGDPLTHPQVVDIVRMVADRGWKPILNTNGLALTEELLREMKQVGLFGLTFHIDSKQHRPKWKNKTEQEHNVLRLHFAEMVARVGGLTCSFNATVYEDTLDDIPGMIAWAQKHIEIVHVMVFICYREPADPKRFDYYAGGRKVDMAPLTYEDTGQRIDLSAHDVVAKIREREPEFAPAAYLGGTAKPDSFKWLLTVRVGTKKRIYGYLGRKMLELAQVWHHLRTGRYMAYAEPAVGRRGRLMAFLLWPIDRGIRKVFWRAVRSPSVLFRRLHLQSIMIISPVEVLDNGEQNMCDGCPDMTVWDGELAWSCRLEECIHFGQFTRTVPKEHAISKAREQELVSLRHTK
jgi:pyruvate-formate lyase-activating enzyme